jgi:hypothetical protein
VRTGGGTDIDDGANTYVFRIFRCEGSKRNGVIRNASAGIRMCLEAVEDSACLTPASVALVKRVRLVSFSAAGCFRRRTCSSAVWCVLTDVWKCLVDFRPHCGV